LGVDITTGGAQLACGCLSRDAQSSQRVHCAQSVTRTV
jgi:hypothetical protein